jgi:16S rRNA (guanine966-N2)-methyltransferase
MTPPDGRLRIIGGQWRSRLVEVVAEPGLRPTPDRVRQTLFDWLAPSIEGARVLDLFAGTGALGLEALSRGAAQVCFVERNASSATALRTALSKLGGGDRGQVHLGDALAWLDKPQTAERFEVALLDPPFDSGLMLPALQRLGRHLAGFNRVYLEWAAGAAPALPDGFEWLREKRAGQVSYGLTTFRGATACP